MRAPALDVAFSFCPHIKVSNTHTRTCCLALVTARGASMVQTCINVPYNGAGAHSRLDGRGGDWTFPPIARHFVGSILAAFRRLPRLVVLLGQTVSCTEHIHTQRHKTFNRMAGTPTTKNVFLPRVWLADLLFHSATFSITLH